MSITNITTENFQDEVMKSDKTVLIDFWAAWCGPCKMLSPVIDEIAAEDDNVKICKVNVDEQPALATQFGVMNIPTVIVIKEGKQVNKSIGFKSKEAIKALL